MTDKKVVLVTRKLPDAVETRLQRDYMPRLNTDDKLYSKDELLAAARTADDSTVCGGSDPRRR